MHPDRQKEIMIAQAEYEMNKEVLLIDFQKIQYYLTKVLLTVILRDTPIFLQFR